MRLTYAAVLAAPVAVLAFSTGPPVKRTGAEVDGGLNCSACHRTFAPANSDPAGRVTIQASNYTPGVKQTLRVTVTHPEARRWGFQLTARAINDETKMAGSFTQTDDILVRCDDGSARGVAPPCNGALEFASHNATSSLTGSNGTKTFEIEWTPPSNEVGAIMLYAAGNVADNGGTNAGDRIYTTSLRILAEGACTLTQRPTLRTAVNGGSFQPGLAPNSMFTVFGQGFAVSGRSRQAGRGDFVDGNFPKELACVAVEVDGRRSPVAYVQNDQINGQVPTITSSGPVRVQVVLNPGRPNELRSDVATVTLQSQSPAFFMFPDNYIAAQIAGTANVVGDDRAIPGARAAKPGELVALYGTGFGLTDPVYQSGELADGQARIAAPFTVTIGGVTLAASDVLYAGLSPGSISGLYQFNVRIPASVSDGNVPVTIQMSGQSTQSGARIPVRR